MNAIVYNTNFEAVFVLDTFDSLVWVDKFNEPGTFELQLPVTEYSLAYVKPNNYLSNTDSEHLMIIEDISFITDAENGNKIKAVGRSLESILDRRIIWQLTNFNNVSLETAIQTLLNDAIVNPTVLDRKIENFAAYTPSNDAYINSLKINHQYTGDNLLDVIKSICVECDLGFKILLNDNHQFVFSLYRGTNRSYNQNTKPYVVFSEEFDNVISSTYTDKISQMKNVALVAGEGTGTARKTKAVGAKQGIDRREYYVDASDIQKGSLSLSKYNALLEKRGVAKLDEVNRRIAFDAQCDTTQLYIFGVDFFLGDIVQIDNYFGIESAAKVTEFTWSYTTSGTETYPTFDPIEETIYSGKNKLATTLESLKTLNTSGEWNDNVWVNNNVVVTVNTDREGRVVGITFNGKNSSDGNIQFQLGVFELSEEDAANNLVLSGCPNGSSSTYRITQYDKTSNADRAINYSGDTLITTLDKTHEYRGRLTFYKNKDFVDVTVYPMVRSISENNSFEPYIPHE